VTAAALDGRVAVVTGVSRRAGIGFAVARRLLDDGFRVLVHGWPGHDEQRPWGADAGGIDALVDALGGAGPRLAAVEADLGDADAPRQVIDRAVAAFGAVDALVANHARSSDVGLDAVTAQELDRTWAVNARAVVLLVQAYAARRDDARSPGRVVLFTSGQHLAPMADELPYAISKGAVHQMTRTLADALADRGVTVNAINPGPVDTGWPSPELRARLAPAFPAGRWGRPEDIAAVVAWLLSADSAWVTGQVIDAEGGFRRHLGR
jgi:3-oxoacyl-[acyl-carrier protein] reductase